jgi:putative copper export protein
MLASTSLASASDVLRISLHVLAACVWVGGQAVMAGLVPVLRGGGDSLPAKAARAFARLSWPAFVVAIATGFWNFAVLNADKPGSAWQMVFGLKLLAVIAAGAFAFLHTKAQTASKRGMTAGIGFLASIVAVVLGVALAG